MKAKKRAPKTAGQLTAETQSAEHAMQAARLKRCGLTCEEIGARLGVSRQRAHQLLQAGIAAYQAEAKQEAAKWLEDSLVELTQAKEEAWVEWQRSRQDRQRRTVKTVPAKTTKGGAKKAKTIEATEMIEGQCADARYIEAITSCIDECAKLLGLCKPTTSISVTAQAAVTAEHPEETKLRRQLATMLSSMFPPAPGEAGTRREEDAGTRGHGDTET